MKRLLGGIAAIATTVGAAAAADMPYTVRAPLNANSWAGPYVGAHLGYQWGSTSNNPTNPWGVMGGFQAGRNWESGALVFGGEIDLSLSGADDRFAPWKFSNPWFGTLRGRLGYGFSNILVYGTLGVAVGGIHAQIAGATERQTHLGWTAGAGLQVALTSTWSARAEYLFVDLAERPYGLTGANHGLTSNILRLGVNYRF
jgi:outer membrane immunogenic protein